MEQENVVDNQQENGQEEPQNGASSANVPIQEDSGAVDEKMGEIVNVGNVHISPAQQAQIDAYDDNSTIIVFSPKTQDAILQSLQSGQNPIQSIAITANLIHNRLASSMEQDGKEKMTEITMCLGAAHLVSELIVLGEAAGLFKLSNVEQNEAFRQTVMKYFADGLKNGSINPIELQKSIEPLMNKEQRKFGEQNMQDIMKTPPPVNMPARTVSPQQPSQQQGQGLLGGGMQ